MTADPWIILSSTQMRAWAKERGWRLVRLTRDRHGYQWRMTKPSPNTMYGRHTMYARLASEVLSLVEYAEQADLD